MSPVPVFLVSRSRRSGRAHGQRNTYRPILDPLVLDPTREPLRGGRARVELPLRILRGSLGDERAFVRERAEDLSVAGAREEDEGPAFVPGLFLWRSSDPRFQCEEGRVKLECTYTTRCRLERRMPPLKKWSASPMLHIM